MTKMLKDPFWFEIQKSVMNECSFGGRLVSSADTMIYSTNSSRYRNIVGRSSAIDFVALTADSSASGVPLKSYLDRRCFQRCDVKVFMVKTEAMAWYMGVFGATAEQCAHANQQKHLCVVACQHASSGKRHAVSQILYLPQIHVYRYSHLTRFDCLLRKHSVIGRVVVKLHEIASRHGYAPQEGLAVQVAPCLLVARTASLGSGSGEEIGASFKACSPGAAGDDDLCIVCMVETRKWRWSRCTHKTDGPSLICGNCKKALLRAERFSRGIIEDNHCFVVTQCIICNQRSEFVRCNPRSKFIRK